jgi:hypothetical protein
MEHGQSEQCLGSGLEGRGFLRRFWHELVTFLLLVSSVVGLVEPLDRKSVSSWGQVGRYQATSGWGLKLIVPNLPVHSLTCIPTRSFVAQCLINHLNG